MEEAGYNITQEEFYEIMQIYSMHSLLIGKRGKLA